jgi:RNA 3'-terminal phosphate cyclase
LFLAGVNSTSAHVVIHALATFADFEASFLRLIEKITNGCGIKINETGTKVSYKPGVLVGGIGHTHDCG